MNYYICATIITIEWLALFFICKMGKHDREDRFELLKYMILVASGGIILTALVKYFLFEKLLGLPKEIQKISIYLALLILLLDSSIQEGIKILPLIFKRLQNKFLEKKEKIYVLGIFCGFGFGLGECWYLAYSLSKKMPQFNYGFENFAMLFGGFGQERFFAVFYHITLTAIASYGFYINKPLKYFLLALFLHSLINFPCLLHEMRELPLYFFISFYITVFILFLSLFVWLNKKVFKKYLPHESVIYRR